MARGSNNNLPAYTTTENILLDGTTLAESARKAYVSYRLKEKDPNF